MSDMMQVVCLAFVAAFLSLVLKEQKPMFAFFVVLCTSIFIFLIFIDYIKALFQMLEILSKYANVDMVYLETILKIIGIAYIAELSAQLMKDAGQGALAQKVELVGKIIILALAMPIIMTIVETIISMIQTTF